MVEVSIVTIIMTMTMALTMIVVTSMFTMTSMTAMTAMIAVTAMATVTMLIVSGVLVHIGNHLVEGLSEGLRPDFEHDEQLALLSVQLIHIDALVYGLIGNSQRQFEHKSVL